MAYESRAATCPAALAAPIKAAIIEDQAIIREGLQALIHGTDGYLCTGAYPDIASAVEGMAADPVDVSLVDIGLPGMSGIEGAALLKARFPRLHIVILTVHSDDARIFDALCAGACGYLLKTTPPARILESLREVVGGGAPMSPEVARRVVELFRQTRAPASAYQLTPHECRILGLLTEGHNYRTAAQALSVSVHTISFHVRSIYQKMQVHSKSEAVAKALRSGLFR
jgi:DNA-binding NarL/FixJ family response regulator